MHRSVSREGRHGRIALRSRLAAIGVSLALAGSAALIAAPAASAVDQPFVVQSPTNGSTVDSTTPTFSGQGTTGSTVTLTYSGQGLQNYTAGTATVTEAGTWSTGPTSFTSANPGETENRVRVSELTTGGVETVFFITINFPTAPVPAAGVFTLDSPTEGETRNDFLNIVHFVGTGDPGNLITVRYFDGRGGLAQAGIGEVTAGGTFDVFATFRDLPAGQTFANTFTLQTTQDGDRVSNEIGRTIFFAVAPVEAAPFRVISPENGEQVDTITPAFTGTGLAGDTVTLTYGGQRLGTYVAGTTTIGADGTWTIPTTDFSDANFGETEIRVSAEATGPNGESRPGGTFVNIVLPAAPAPLSDFTLTTPEEGDTIENPRLGVPYIGTGEPGNTIVVEYFNGRGGLSEAGTAIVEDDGTFEVTAFFDDLPVGQLFANTFTQQEDADGNRVAREIGRNINFAVPAVVAPLAPPTLDQPVVDGTTVTFSGTGIAGATIEVSVVNAVPPVAGDAPAAVPAEGGVLTATVQEDGTWTVSDTFVAGDYIATATQFTTDGADRSAPTEAREFTVVAAPAPTPDPAPAPTPGAGTTPGAGAGGQGGQGGLPVTGFDAGAALLLLSALLMAAGAAVVATKRVRAER